MHSTQMKCTRGTHGASPLQVPHKSAARHLRARKVQKVGGAGMFVQPDLRRHEGATHTTRVASESAQQSAVQPVQQVRREVLADIHQHDEIRA